MPVGLVFIWWVLRQEPVKIALPFASLGWPEPAVGQSEFKVYNATWDLDAAACIANSRQGLPSRSD